MANIKVLDKLSLKAKEELAKIVKNKENAIDMMINNYYKNSTCTGFDVSARFQVQHFALNPQISTLKTKGKDGWWQNEEYEANRKRLFPKLLAGNDFYNAVHKCEITQKEFNKWYFRDQDRFIATGNATDFYKDTTVQLMDKYLKARAEGKNKPDSARAVGLSNAIIDKWLRHVEYGMFRQFN